MALLLAGALMLSSTLMDPAGLDTLAEEAGVSVPDLVAAAATVGVTPHDYLVGEGLLAGEPPAPPPAPALNASVERLLDCIAHYESHATPSARNPVSGAAGEFQFLLSTWATTPQGRAGMSPYDPVAARAAARWMIGQGRSREWVPVARGLC